MAVIEGGGSTCRGLVYDLLQNRITESITLKDHPCNIYREPKLTLFSIRKMVSQLDVESCPLTLCLPGISHIENVAGLKQQLETDGFETISIASDAIAALLGAYDTLEDGQGIFIGGTGTIALGYAKGQFWRAGTPETEKACGPWIARKAWALSALDPDLRRIFGADQNSFQDTTDVNNHIMGLLAPAIFRAADSGNLAAASILQEAADSAANHMNCLKDFGITRFVLCGSVASRLQNRIPVATQSACGSGMDGALKLALSVYRDPRTLSFFTSLRRIEDNEERQIAISQ